MKTKKQAEAVAPKELVWRCDLCHHEEPVTNTRYSLGDSEACVHCTGDEVGLAMVVRKGASRLAKRKPTWKRKPLTPHGVKEEEDKDGLADGHRHLRYSTAEIRAALSLSPSLVAASRLVGMTQRALSKRVAKDPSLVSVFEGCRARGIAASGKRRPAW